MAALKSDTSPPAPDPSGASSRRLPPLSLQHTLLISLVAGAALFAMVKPISAIDLTVFLRMGAWMHEHGGILEHDPFALSASDRHFLNGTWLAQKLFYALFSLTGYPGMQVLLALLLGLTLSILARLTHRVSSLKAAVVGVFLALTCIVQNLAIRPQSFSLPLFALLLLVLLVYPRRRFALPVAALSMALWANLHGAFPIAFALPASLGFDALLWQWLGLDRSSPPRVPAEKSSLQRLQTLLEPHLSAPEASFGRYLALGLAMLAGSCLTPYGPGIYQYVLDNSAGPVARGLSEWLPPDPSTFLGGRFYAALILTSLLLLSVFRRVRPSEILLFAAFSLLAIKSQRMIVWWGMVSAPLLCRWLLLWKPSLALPPRVRTSHHRLGQLMLGFWVLLFFAGWPTRQSPQLDSRGDYRGLDKDTPVETATFLLQHTRPGEPQRLFHRLEWGSYFMWRLWPSFQTFIDIRVWIFDDEHWNAVLSAGRAEPGWQDLLDRYQITWLALSLETQKPLIDAVLQDPRWVERHRDGLGVVFERRP